jgi:hypothetical protein
MENVGNVTFVASSTTPTTISCAEMRISDIVPRSESNPNAGGDVFDGVRVEGSNSATIGRCSIIGEEIELSGGIQGVPTVAWNALEGIFLATMSFRRMAFLWTHANRGPIFGTCFITIGRFPVESIVGRWTNNFPTSTVAFQNQSLFADISGRCPQFGTFDQVRFSGTFRVSSPRFVSVIVEP